jgi:predicted small integral membrane protein
MIPRYLKIKLVATAALFLSLVAFGNLTAYDVNFAFVEGVMKMETIGKDPGMAWRAIDSTTLHHVFYWIIIVWQIVAAVGCWIGVWRLYRARKSGVIAFQNAKSAAIFGLGAGLLLYFFAFITIGGEWFAMWRSQVWNGQSASHMIVSVFGIVLIYLSMRDEDVRLE